MTPLPWFQPLCILLFSTCGRCSSLTCNRDPLFLGAVTVYIKDKDGPWNVNMKLCDTCTVVTFRIYSGRGGGLIPQSSVRSFLSAKFSGTTGKSRTPLWTSDRDVSGSLLQRLRIQTNIIHILCMPLEATARKTGLILKVKNVQTYMPVFGST